MQGKTVYRKDYHPPAFTILTVSLDFDLHDDYARVQNRMHLQRQGPGDLCLYGEELNLLSLHLDGQLLSEDTYLLEENTLLIRDCPDDCTLTIVTEIYPQKNTALSGLYRSNQLFCTQCEAEGFRRITYYLDRPDVLALFTTKMCADKTKYPVLLSNGNLVQQGETPDGRHWALWEDPFKKPSYLFALVAGQLACVADRFTTCSGKAIDLQIYVEPGNENKCAHAMASLQNAMRWDEAEFGREYDLDIYMIVAVSDFNMGAMENKGLNIFNSKYVLARADTATDQDYEDVEGVIGHEYFHNWTGNRITCRDWFQLSLKEGLTVFRDQEFSRAMNSPDVNRIKDVKALRSTQFPEDAGSMAHPVRPDSFQEINNFYTATIYNKGAEVIRMQQTLLKKEGFRKGMDLYFERHDGQAVTIDDFVAAMEDANQVDLAQFKLWYSQAGTPEITVETSYQANTLTLHLSQYCPPTAETKDKKPFHIPIKIGLFTAAGEPIPLANDILELKQARQSFHFENLPEKPLVSFLRDFSAPVIVHRDLDEAELLNLLHYDDNGFAKWDVAQQIATQCMLACYEDKHSQWQIPARLKEAYTAILANESLDAALRAELMILPSFEEMSVSLKDIEVTRLEAARYRFRKLLGDHLFTQAESLYLELWEKEDHSMHPEAYRRRKLRNVCLWLMMKGREVEAIPLCREQFAKAKTMTDQIASLALLVNCGAEEFRHQAIADFYQQWKKEDLVVDKWFSLQAMCELPGTLDHVKQLLDHETFKIKNPNKVRALVGAFVQGNPRHFHAEDGSGYAFLVEMLLKLDPINPQIAARLATPLTRMKRLSPLLKSKMQQALTQLSQASLSKDLTEVVSKSLSAV